MKTIKAGWQEALSLIRQGRIVAAFVPPAAPHVLRLHIQDPAGQKVVLLVQAAIALNGSLLGLAHNIALGEFEEGDGIPWGEGGT